MLVTLIADASHRLNPTVSAWAFWVRTHHGTLKQSGVFKNPMRDSNHAEMAAIANAIHHVLNHPVGHGATKILIQTDSKATIKAFEGTGIEEYQAVMEVIRSQLGENGLEVEFRHVKGHSGTGTPRTYCHDWCDREAKRQAVTAWRRKGGKKRPSRRRYRHSKKW